MQFCEPFSNSLFLSSFDDKLRDHVLPHFSHFKFENYVVLIHGLFLLFYWFNGVCHWVRVIVLHVVRGDLAFWLMGWLDVLAIKWVVKLIPFCCFSYHRHRRTLSLAHFGVFFWWGEFVENSWLLLMLFYDLNRVFHWDFVDVFELLLCVQVIYGGEFFWGWLYIVSESCLGFSSGFDGEAKTFWHAKCSVRFGDRSSNFEFLLSCLFLWNIVFWESRDARHLVY